MNIYSDPGIGGVADNGLNFRQYQQSAFLLAWEPYGDMDMDGPHLGERISASLSAEFGNSMATPLNAYVYMQGDCWITSGMEGKFSAS